MKMPIVIFLLIPCLSWGLTFKNGKQLQEDNCANNEYIFDDELSKNSFDFDIDSLLKTNHSFTAYKKHTPPNEPPVKSVNYLETKMYASGDIDSDGYDDLVLSFLETNVAPVILYGKKSRDFDVSELQNLSTNFARKNFRKIILDDINNDNLLDIIGFTTSEHHPGFDIGEPNILLKNLGDRKFEEIELPEFRKLDSTHGGFVADIDNDNFVDIIAVTDPAAPGLETYPIKNVNGKKFELIKKDINKDISNSMSHDGDGGDLNNDGFIDLVIDSVITENLSEQNDFKTLRVILGDGDFDFSDNKVIKLGKNWITKDQEKIFVNEYLRNLQTGSSNISLIDINDDDLLDILQGYYLVDYTGGWMSSGFKSYINKGNDCFEDETNKYFPNQTLNRRLTGSGHSDFISNFHYADVNNDGFKDLALGTFINMNRAIFHKEVFPYLFMNVNNEYYLPLNSSQAQKLKYMSNYILGDFDGDGFVDIGGLTDPGVNSLNVIWGGSKASDAIKYKKVDEDLLKDLDFAIQ
jgi:hypothetical protein